MKTKNILAIAILFLSHCFFAQIPILNSNSTSNKVVYLDFDGQSVSGTAYNTSYSITTINAAPSTMSSANIIQIWKRISEDYRPFDVNITTDSTKFNSAIINFRIRIIITATNSWYGTSAGGLAYFGSFNWGGNPGTSGWVFENMLLNNPKHIAESCSHEVGHSLSLKHQSTWTTSTCSKTAEYNPGQGSGITSWAPIMGVGYYKNVTIWHKGTNSTSCTFIQSDHGITYPGITAGYLAFLPDDVGDTYAAGKMLNLSTALVKDSGIITQPTDIDVYKFQICNSRYISFDVKPWALDTVNYDAANLDVRFQLFDATNNSLAIDTPLTQLKTLVGINLTAGSYYFTIDGGGSVNYSDYGSLGKYYITISSNNIPAVTSVIASNSVACAGQSINFTDASTGGPTTWAWILPGAIPASSSLQNPIVVYNVVGTYTVTLSATNGTASACPITKIISVSPVFTVSAVASNTMLCVGETSTLNFSGASNYTLNPGSITTNPAVVSPTSSVNYTVTGANSSGCLNNAIVNITINSCTGIENYNDQSELNLRIYPNPATSSITIEIEKNSYSFEIVNALGALIYKQENIKEHFLNIKTDTWAKGIYFVKAFSENTKEQVIRKLIIL